MDGSIRVWDLETGTQVGEEWEDKDHGVRATALSPDGKKVASGSMDGTVKLWNIDTEYKLGEFCELESRWRASGERIR
jgi:WD40 repeat protein